jgi:hypothetical protein
VRNDVSLGHVREPYIDASFVTRTAESRHDSYVRRLCQYVMAADLDSLASLYFIGYQIFLYQVLKDLLSNREVDN